MQEQRRAFVVGTVLLCALLSVVIFAQKTGTSPLPQPPTGSSSLLVEPTYIDRAVRGTSVSITVTPDGHTLFVAVVDKEDGLRIYRIPVRSVP
jgi:hypothetical protein